MKKFRFRNSKIIIPMMSSLIVAPSIFGYAALSNSHNQNVSIYDFPENPSNFLFYSAETIKAGNEDLSGKTGLPNQGKQEGRGNIFEPNYFCNLTGNQSDIGEAGGPADKCWNNNHINHGIDSSKYDWHWPTKTKQEKGPTTPWGKMFDDSIGSGSAVYAGHLNMGTFFNGLIHGKDSIDSTFRSNLSQSGYIVNQDQLGKIKLEFIVPKFEQMRIYLSDHFRSTNSDPRENYNYGISFRITGQRQLNTPADSNADPISFIERYDLKDTKDQVASTGGQFYKIIRKPADPKDAEHDSDYNVSVNSTEQIKWIEDSSDEHGRYFPITPKTANVTATSSATNTQEPTSADQTDFFPIKNGPTDSNDDEWMFDSYKNSVKDIPLNYLRVPVRGGFVEYRFYESTIGGSSVKAESKIYAFSNSITPTFDRLWSFGETITGQVEIPSFKKDPKPWTRRDKIFGILLGTWVGTVSLGVIAYKTINNRKNIRNKAK